MHICIFGLCPDDKELNDIFDKVKSICEKAPECEFMSSETKEGNISDYEDCDWDLSGYDKLYKFEINIEFGDNPIMFSSRLVMRSIRDICGKYLLGVVYIKHKVKLNEV